MVGDYISNTTVTLREGKLLLKRALQFTYYPRLMRK